MPKPISTKEARQIALRTLAETEAGLDAERKSENQPIGTLRINLEFLNEILLLPAQWEIVAVDICCGCLELTVRGPGVDASKGRFGEIRVVYEGKRDPDGTEWFRRKEPREIA